MSMSISRQDLGIVIKRNPCDTLINLLVIEDLYTHNVCLHTHSANWSTKSQDNKISPIKSTKVKNFIKVINILNTMLL